MDEQEIRNRVLVVGQPKTGKLRLLKGVFGSLPVDIPEESHGGIVHDVKLTNKYYQADICVWIDEYGNRSSPGISDSELGSADPDNADDALEQWVDTFVSEEAEEVRNALAAVIITFDIYQPWESTLKHLKPFLRFAEVVRSEREASSEDEVLVFAVGIPVAESEAFQLLREQGTSVETALETNKQSLEDELMNYGVEFVCVPSEVSESGGRNRFGESVGFHRIKEALDAFPWSTMVPAEKAYAPLKDKTGDESAEPQAEPQAEPSESPNQDQEAELRSMLESLRPNDKDSGDGSDAAVLSLDEIMKRAHQMRAKAREIESESERKAFAQDFVEDIMKLV